MAQAVNAGDYATLSPDRRRQIIRVAAKLFAERGFSRTTMKDIAAQLNFTKPILYNHFKNKNEVLLECYRFGSAITLEGLARAEPNCRNGIEKVRSFIKVYVKSVIGEVGTCLVLLDDKDLADAERLLGRQYRQSVEGRLRSYIEEGIADGTVRKPSDVGMAVLVIAGAMNSLGYWYKAGGRLTVDEISARMCDLLARTLENDRTEVDRGVSSIEMVGP